AREEQDRWALRSHERALKAIADGKFAEEIIHVEVPQRRGEPIVVTDDEGPRADTNEEKLAKLRPAFTKDGTITAGNAPGVNDGACAFVMMSEEKAAELNKEPLAIIHGQATVGVEAKNFPQTPGIVINELFKKTGKTAEDIDL